jgi:hypothetical protein
MHRSKRVRLEAKGWRLRSAQEFLGLSDQESTYVELRLRLAESLRVRRQKRKLSQTDLAKMLRSSQSRVGRWRAAIHRFPSTSWSVRCLHSGPRIATSRARSLAHRWRGRAVFSA